ncbi:unnamed protein product [Trichobilharzia szidati]|nr:unnamed protein product [Trichobilharzia szidati]
MKEGRLLCTCGLFVGIVLLFFTLSPYSPTCLLRSCIHGQYKVGFSSPFQSKNNEDSMLNHFKTNGKNESVLVFLHIQKTTGTLIERRLVKDGLVNKNCYCFGRRRCSCRTQNGNTWLVSRYSTGWLCGLHADLTELTECVDNKLNKIDRRTLHRRYIYFTILRDPIDRFISEWQHTRRGATWISASLRCNRQSPPFKYYKPCSFFINNDDVNNNTTDWLNVTMQSFLNCPYNLAHNRQTRMLANLSRLECYKHLTEWSQPVSNTTSLTSISSVQLALLNSAKHNLVNVIRCYGLSEYLVYSQYILQKCLRITFKRSFIEFNKLSIIQQRLLYTHATIARSNLSSNVLDKIANVNRLDILLHNFAEKLFLYRLVRYLLFDSSLPMHFKRPLYTVWEYYYKHKSDTPLRILLFSNLIDYDNINSTANTSRMSSFSHRLNLFLTHLFIRKGSVPVAETVLINENRRWRNKLAYDLKA